MHTSFLTSDILEETHTAAEYLEWVRDLVAKVKAEPDGLERIRLRKGLVKELMNEALPIGLICSKYFDDSRHVGISLKIGNQNFDAEVSDTRSDCSSVQFIEVTLATEGEDDYLRMRVLHEAGSVSGLGGVSKTSTKKKGLKIEVASEMVSQEEVLRRERERVSQAIERKINGSYPSNTLLLIGFDDTMSFDRNDNISNLQSVLYDYAPKLNTFQSVAIVRLQQGLFIRGLSKNAI